MAIRARGRFSVRIKDEQFDLIVRDGGIELDNAAADASLVHVAGAVWSLLLNGRSYSVAIGRANGNIVPVTIENVLYEVSVQDARARILDRFQASQSKAPATAALVAPMPGLVLSVHVEAGEAVEPGQGILVLEAMKMENELRASSHAVVQAVRVAPGDAVTKHAVLVEFSSEDATVPRIP